MLSVLLFLTLALAPAGVPCADVAEETQLCGTQLCSGHTCVEVGTERVCVGKACATCSLLDAGVWCKIWHPSLGSCHSSCFYMSGGIYCAGVCEWNEYAPDAGCTLSGAAYICDNFCAGDCTPLDPTGKVCIAGACADCHVISTGDLVCTLNKPDVGACWLICGWDGEVFTCRSGC